jgi:hypothetical protein
MNYVVSMMGGSTYRINEAEYRNLAGKSGLVHVPSLDMVINLSSVVKIESEERYAQSEVNRIDRTKQNEGLLHDGTRMIKQFGQWFLADGERDENGRLVSKADPDYYPEIRSGVLPTYEEYETKFKSLPASKWSQTLIGRDMETPIELTERKSNLLSDDYGHI